MEKQKHLNRLLRRRQELLQMVNKITQSKDETDENTPPSKEKSTPPKKKRFQSTVSTDFTDSTNCTIEDSDIDNSINDEISLSARERKLYLYGKTESDNLNTSNRSLIQKQNEQNVVVHSNSDTSDNMINTSTVSLELTHSFFNDSSDTSKTCRVPGVDQIDSNISCVQSLEPPKKRPKITILSDEKVEIIDNNLCIIPKHSLQPTIIENHYEPEKEATYFTLCNVQNIKTTIDHLQNTSDDLTHAKTETETPANLNMSDPFDYTAITIDTSSLEYQNNTNVGVFDIKNELCTTPGITAECPNPICIVQDPALNSHSSQLFPDNTSKDNITESWNQPGTSYEITDDWSRPGVSRDVTEHLIQVGPSFEHTATVNLLGPSDMGNSSKSNHKVKKRPKRKFKEVIKKSHIDFLSDEELFSNCPENDDYSAGSSEQWSTKESEVSETSIISQTNKINRKKRVSKKKSKPIGSNEQEKIIAYKKEKPDNNRKNRKMKREKGDSYETSSGKLKEAKILQPNPCLPGKCPRGCNEILDDRRQRIFDYFWNLNIQRKRDWLVHCASRVPIKRKKTDSIESKRQCTYEYYVNEGEGRRQICQQFLLKTLNITQNFLLYTLYNAHKEGLSQEEKRHQPTEKFNKYDEATVNAAKEYIESLPLLPSHYCRKSSNRLYLPQEFKTFTNLYRLYKISCEQKKTHYLSEHIFRKLLNTEYNNISIHVPKKDKCNICAKYENNPNEAEKNKEKIKAHMEEKEATYERFISHQNYSGNKDTIVASFDLQKILNTPHGDNILLFYSRKYTVFNFTVYESSTQNGFCYVWGECDGKRGAKDIGSCLFKYLKEVDKRKIKRLILYCDSCTGQNRNRTILAILHYFLTISKNIETIQINYLLTGHSYMPVDSMHSVIEREVRKLTVWSYTQWPSYMESARKNPRPYAVTVMEHTDFINWDPITEKTFPSKTKDLQVTKIRIATMKKKNLKTIETKHSMKVGATPHVIKVNEEWTAKTGNSNPDPTTSEKGKGKGKGKGTGKGKGKGRAKVSVNMPLSREDSPFSSEGNELKPLYNTKLPISLKKYKDLKKICDVMPSRFHNDYLQLPFSSEVKDTLTETDREDNVDDSNQ